jgi:hypothetical protein
VLNLAGISVIHPALFVNTKRKKNQAAIPNGEVMLLRSEVASQ